jgi:hypothetical protein
MQALCHERGSIEVRELPSALVLLTGLEVTARPEAAR